ncbi:MAG: hypothetical protein HY965_02930 [Ignavibacteriales bacterium]|nr:hypothetical protein [Ignavibacteriales bacterium]
MAEVHVKYIMQVITANLLTWLAVSLICSFLIVVYKLILVYTNNSSFSFNLKDLTILGSLCSITLMILVLSFVKKNPL